VESLSVILVSEIGDKTFFIAAILAMQGAGFTVPQSSIFYRLHDSNCDLATLG